MNRGRETIQTGTTPPVSVPFDVGLLKFEKLSPPQNGSSNFLMVIAARRKEGGLVALALHQIETKHAEMKSSARLRSEAFK